MTGFEIAFIVTVVCFFIGRVSGLMLFTRLPAEYQAGFQTVMNPFGRNGFIQVILVLLVIATLVRTTSIPVLYLGVTQVIVITIILTLRQIQTHKILQGINLPKKHSSQFWLSRTFTLVSLLSFFLLLIIFLSPKTP